MQEQKQLVKICRVGGREFLIYREYDEQAQMHYLTYPNFVEHPQYTADGKPFTRSDRVDCSHYKPKDPGEPSGECDDCRLFHREETPLDVIGVCMCDSLRHGAGGKAKMTRRK